MRKPSPNPALLHSYLRDAQPTRDDVRQDGVTAVDARRVEAVRALHNLSLQWKAGVAEVSGRALPLSEELEAFGRLHRYWITSLGAPPDFDRALRDFFDRAGRVIFASPDPSVAMRAFWEGAPRRGRRAEANAARDFDLAVAVQKRVNDGATIEDASAAVGENARPRLSEEAVRKVYYRRRLEVCAALELWAPLSDAED